MTKIILAIIIFSLSSCSREHFENIKKRDQEMAEEYRVRDENYCPKLNLSRGHYRDHLYIFNHGRFNFSFIHDPDCPCFKMKKE